MKNNNKQRYIAMGLAFTMNVSAKDYVISTNKVQEKMKQLILRFIIYNG